MPINILLKKYSVILLSLLMALSSCMSNKRMTKILSKKVQNATHIWSFHNDYVSIQAPNLAHSDSLVVCKPLKQLFIPAILYWQWNSTIQCNINPSFGVGNFKSAFLSRASEVKLKEKLNGRKLELSIERMPNSFVYTHRGHILILIVFYTLGEVEAIYAEAQTLEVKYRVLNGEEVTKQGTISLKSRLSPQQNEWRSAKKFTQQYVDNYWADVANLSGDFVDELIEEL